MSAGYRNIKFDRVYNSKCTVFDSSSGLGNQISIPKVKNSQYEVKHRTKAEFKAYKSEIKCLSDNHLYTNNFISCDDFKVFLWDMNSSKEIYNPIDLANPALEVSLIP